MPHPVRDRADERAFFCFVQLACTMSEMSKPRLQTSCGLSADRAKIVYPRVDAVSGPESCVECACHRSCEQRRNERDADGEHAEDGQYAECAGCGPSDREPSAPQGDCDDECCQERYRNDQ